MAVCLANAHHSFQVPDESQITIDFSDPTNSSVTGFSESDISPLPFQSNVDADDFGLSVALRHRVQLGFDFDAFGVGANVGIFLDLPRLEANVTHLTNVDENCVSLANSQSKNKDTLQAVLTDVYEIAPTVFWGVGFDGRAHVSGPSTSFWPNGVVISRPCTNFKTAGDSHQG